MKQRHFKFVVEVDVKTRKVSINGEPLLTATFERGRDSSTEEVMDYIAMCMEARECVCGCDNFFELIANGADHEMHREKQRKIEEQNRVDPLVRIAEDMIKTTSVEGRRYLYERLVREHKGST